MTCYNFLVIDYGLWAGKFYAGGQCVYDPQLIDRKMLEIPAIGYYDAVTKQHDVNYQYIEKMYADGDAKNRAFFDADMAAMKNFLMVKPAEGDFIGATYRKIFITAFYEKQSGVFSEEMSNQWTIWQRDGIIEPGLVRPDVFGAASSLLQVQALKKVGFEALTTWGEGGLNRETGGPRVYLTAEEQNFFNEHLMGKDLTSLATYNKNLPDGIDYGNRIIIPKYDQASNTISWSGNINGKWVEMTLDKSNLKDPSKWVFTKNEIINGQNIETVYTPMPDYGSNVVNDPSVTNMSYRVERFENGQKVWPDNIINATTGTIDTTINYDERLKVVKDGLYDRKQTLNDFETVVSKALNK